MNMNQSIISVIMPAYNTQKYVADAINSIINQTYPYWELLAIDDGSNDKTGMIIDNYASLDKRIVAVHTENFGVSHARNLGLQIAKGKWIAFLDSDDIYDSKAFEKLMSASENCDLVKGSYRCFPTEVTHILPNMKFNNVDEEKENIKDLLSGDFFSTTWAAIYKKKAINIVFDETQKFAEDTLFFIKLLNNCNSIRTISDIVYLYRKNVANSLITQALNIRISHIEKIIESLRERYGNNEAMRQYYTIWYILFFNDYVASVWHEDTFDKNEKIRLTNKVINRESFKKIPVINYGGNPIDTHAFIILKTGDMDLIEKEMNGYKKRNT